MTINISREMADVIVLALEEHCKSRGWKFYGKRSHGLSNRQALDFFREVLVDCIEEQEKGSTEAQP